ncbi:hypothetical protein BGX24_003474 [Mortierella sp. AD032]|nr:hypothetical protein BGX24_003474 [Mortierella sp. AD032]
MPPQRPAAYYGSPPGPAAPPSASVAGHYRRPSSPGPYGNPPPGAYGSAPPPATSTPQTHSSIYQPAGPGHDQDMHERELGMRAPHSPPLSRTGHPSYAGSSSTSRTYAARSPSPGHYGSSPDNMSYRHYYEQQQQQQQQQHQRHARTTYRQEYYVSDGEGEANPMGQHHPYQQPQPSHNSRAPTYRAWPAGSHEASGRDYPPSASHQSTYYANSRQTVQPDRYESTAPAPVRPVSPYQSSYGRAPTHSVHPPASTWTSTRSPEVPPRTGLNYRRRSASVDEGIDREKRNAAIVQ